VSYFLNGRTPKKAQSREENNLTVERVVWEMQRMLKTMSWKANTPLSLKLVGGLARSTLAIPKITSKCESILNQSILESALAQLNYAYMCYA